LKKEKIVVFVATWHYSGLIPPVLVAGTYGSFFALPLCYGAIIVGNYSVWLYLLIIAAVYFVGRWSVPLAEIVLGSRQDRHGDFRVKDQGQIVIDEVLGMLISCAPLIWLKTIPLYWGMFFALFLFRIFDAAKPKPASYFHLQEGWIGVMADDVVAGLYTVASLTIVLQIIKQFLPQ